MATTDDRFAPAAARSTMAIDPESGDFVGGVILAAGSSARMGRPKPLLPLGDRPLLQHVLDAAAASFLKEIALVLGTHAAAVCEVLELPPGREVRIVSDPDCDRDQSTSLRIGLRTLDPRATAAAVLLGDQPGLSTSLIDRIGSAFLSAGDALAARPSYRRTTAGEAVPGHPVFLARRLWSEIEQLRGDEGARSLFASRPDWLLEIPVEGEPPADIDTPEDYRREQERNRTNFR